VLPHSSSCNEASHAGTLLYQASSKQASDSKVFQMLKQKVLKQQEESKAREEYLLQRQLTLEETVKKQSEDIQRLVALIQQQQPQPNP